MLYRKKEKNILNWYKNGHGALLVTGARQVGKTYLIEHTLTNNKIDFVKINLIEKKEFLNSLNVALEKSPQDFLSALTNAFNKPLKDNMVIFIDEVQEAKDIVTIIKFLVTQTKYKYILSGSLLGIELTNLRSAPVGYMEYIDLYPLDFEEYLLAVGVSNETISKLKLCFEQRKEVNPVIHNKLINLFYKYLIVGGMPQVVDEFIKTNDLNRVRNIQSYIKESYKKDFTKYESIDKKLKLIQTYDLIPSELNSKNKRYNLASLSSNNRIAKYEDSFNWLNDAGVSLPVYNVTDAKIPLEINKKYNLFKLFLSDVGLLTSSYGRETTIRLLENGKDINCGAIYENAIAQELKCHGFKTYYYNNKKHGEVDFVIEYKGNILPIEVKSDKDYKFHSALCFLCKQNNLKHAIVFNNYNTSVVENKVYYPIYMIMFLNEYVEKEWKITLDTEGLK